jgi:hypothetical protein
MSGARADTLGRVGEREALLFLCSGTSNAGVRHLFLDALYRLSHRAPYRNDASILHLATLFIKRVEAYIHVLIAIHYCLHIPLCLVRHS